MASEQQPAKTLWDWLGLLATLAIPVVVGFGVAWFTRTQQLRDQEHEKLLLERDQETARIQHEHDQQLADQRAKSDRDIAQDNQLEKELQDYIDKMSELLLDKHLGELLPNGKADQKYRQQQNGNIKDELKPEYEQVRNIARVRTITLLTQLNARRIGYVFTFLREAGLMSTASNDNVVSLKDADLRSVKWSQANLGPVNFSRAILAYVDLSGANLLEANLSHARLNKANLSRAFLGRADLSGANLSEVNLSGAELGYADLSGANLTLADLSGANLSGANLSGAAVTEEQLNQAKSLEGATMRDGSRHPLSFPF